MSVAQLERLSSRRPGPMMRRRKIKATTRGWEGRGWRARSCLGWGARQLQSRRVREGRHGSRGSARKHVPDKAVAAGREGKKERRAKRPLRLPRTGGRGRALHASPVAAGGGQSAEQGDTGGALEGAEGLDVSVQDWGQVGRSGGRWSL